MWNFLASRAISSSGMLSYYSSEAAAKEDKTNPKVDDILDSMVFTSSNNFSECWTIVLLFRNEDPISLLYIDIMLLFTLVHRAIPICMENGSKSRIVHFLLHIIACDLSLCVW
jgi:hypothetical protein